MTNAGRIQHCLVVRLIKSHATLNKNVSIINQITKGDKL